MRLELFVSVQFSKGLGSWSVALYQKEDILAEARGGLKCSSIQEMELEAIADGIASAKEIGATKIVVHGSSAYFRSAFTKWSRYWHEHAWKDSQNRDVQYPHLWDRILADRSKVHVTFRIFPHKGFKRVASYSDAIRIEQDASLRPAGRSARIIREPKAREYQVTKGGKAA